jgi:F-type H+-transporting ATPase subunit alpha
MLIEKDIISYGVIISVGSGVASLQGLTMAFVGEVFIAGGTTSSSSSIGIVVNLSRDVMQQLTIGSLLIDVNHRLYQGSKVTSFNRLASIIVGSFAIGSILDPIGRVIYNSTSIEGKCSWVIESKASGIIDRQSVNESMLSGILSIDAMVPVGRGQRELIVGDRQTGKSSISLDTIFNQKYETVLCVYIPIGQKASSILQTFVALVQRDSTFYLSVLAGSASSSAVSQFICSYSGTTLSEYFMVTSEISSFVCYDDLSRHAMAYREIYLLLRRAPGREAYPGEIFFVHSRLLERSGKLNYNLGGGSITSFPIIETLAGDVSAYITTNVISITDGQVFLSADLFVSGIKPSIDVGLSVTRVGSACQWFGMKLIAGSYKLQLAQFIELQSFSQFAADLGEATKQRLESGQRIIETLKQLNGAPISHMHQVGIMSLTSSGCMSRVPLGSITSLITNFITQPLIINVMVPIRYTINNLQVGTIS